MSVYLGLQDEVGIFSAVISSFGPSNYLLFRTISLIFPAEETETQRVVRQLARDHGANNWSGILEGKLTVSVQQQRQQRTTKSA